MHRDLRTLDAEVTAALRGLATRETQETPAGHPEKWSIQQIVEHLLSTYRGSTPAIKARVDKRSGTQAKPTLRQRIGQFFVIGLGHFPAGRKAPEAVSPSAPVTLRSGDDLASKVTAELVKLDGVAAEAERIFGNRRAVSHMVLGPLSMQQWRRFHLIHGRHHIKQIMKIRKQNEL
jgi:hypothetical protein